MTDQAAARAANIIPQKWPGRFGRALSGREEMEKKLGTRAEKWADDYNFRGGLWTPARLGSALAIWLDAEDASTITLNGTTVSQWDDKSGNGRHATQESASIQPVYTASSLINAMPAVDFTTAVTYLRTPVIPNNSIAGNLPISLFGVFHVRFSNSGFQSPIGTRLDGGSWWIFMRPQAGDQEIGFHDASQRWSGTYVTDKNAILSWQVTANNILTTHLDGSLIQTVSPVTQFTSKTDSFVQIGAGSTASSTEDYEGLIGEIVFFTSEISTEDRQKLEGYLAHKWGLVANLPPDHPYESVQP